MLNGTSVEAAGNSVGTGAFVTLSVGRTNPVDATDTEVAGIAEDSSVRPTTADAGSPGSGFHLVNIPDTNAHKVKIGHIGRLEGSILVEAGRPRPRKRIEIWSACDRLYDATMRDRA